MPAAYIEQFANTCQSTLSSAILNSTNTTITITATTPDFPLVGNFRILVDQEIMLVTARTGGAYTVVRGIEGTTATTHANGAQVTAILTGGSVTQALSGNYAVTTSTLNTYAATLPTAPVVYEVGPYLINFNTANTDGATLNLNGLGAVNIQINGVNVIAGQIIAGQTRLLIYDGTNFQIVGVVPTPAQGNIDGLITAKNSSQSISVNPGKATDSGDVFYLSLTSTFYKSLAGAWSQGAGTSGSPKNGLDTGLVAANTWYNVYLISEANGTTDIIFSTSATGPALPTNWYYYRLIGSVLTDGSSNILAYLQVEDWFWWETQLTDVSGASLTASTATSETLKYVPANIPVIAQLAFAALLSAGAGLTAGSTSISSYSGLSAFDVIGQSTQYSQYSKQVQVDSSSKIQLYCSGTVSSTLSIATQGYRHPRGRKTS